MSDRPIGKSVPADLFLARNGAHRDSVATSSHGTLSPDAPGEPQELSSGLSGPSGAQPAPKAP